MGGGALYAGLDLWVDSSKPGPMTVIRSTLRA